MASTIVWWAVAIVTGAAIGLAVGHLSVCAAWLKRVLDDPILPPGAVEREAPPRDQLGSTP